MGPEEFLGVVLMLPAVDSDLRTETVENGWLLVCFCLSMAMKLVRHGPAALPAMAAGFGLPLLLLWPLFRIRALGAGDCKLLAVLGLLLGPEAIVTCMTRMFLFGGMLALPLLFLDGMARERFRYLLQYVRAWAETGRLAPYRKAGPGTGILHMTVPMFLAVMLWAGGW